MEKKLASGILWWKPKQWERAKRVSSDGEDFVDTYQDWKEGAERTLRNLKDLGVEVYKIEVELDELVQWCKKQKIPLDGKARSRYTAMKVEKIQEK